MIKGNLLIPISIENLDYFTLGLFFDNIRNYGAAVRNYILHLKHIKDDIRTTILVGILFQKLEKFDSAEKYYRKAITKDPNNFTANLNLILLYISLKQPHLANDIILKNKSIFSKNMNFILKLFIKFIQNLSKKIDIFFLKKLVDDNKLLGLEKVVGLILISIILSTERDSRLTSKYLFLCKRYSLESYLSLREII